jgi:integrase/recombinase XerC
MITVAAPLKQKPTEAKVELSYFHCPTSMYILMHQYLKYIKTVEPVAKKTYDNRFIVLNRFLNEYNNPDVQAITLLDVDNYLFQRAQVVKGSTVNMDKQALRSFFEYCQTRRNIKLDFDYTMIKRSREKSPRVKTFTREEIERVLEQCDQALDAMMIAVLYETGMRIQELADLRVDDVRGCEIQIRGKGSKDRMVMITPQLSMALRYYLVDRRISRGHIFQPLQHHRNHPNEKFGTCRIRERIQRQFKRYGIDKMHPHQLRHSFALNWLRSGGDIRSLQKLLGHESIETTQYYLNLTDNHLADEYRHIIKHSVAGVLVRQ